MLLARVRINAGGQAKILHRFATKGRFVIHAVYGGDNNFAASTKSITEQIRRKHNPAVGS